MRPTHSNDQHGAQYVLMPRATASGRKSVPQGNAKCRAVRAARCGFSVDRSRLAVLHWLHNFCLFVLCSLFRVGIVIRFHVILVGLWRARWRNETKGALKVHFLGRYRTHVATLSRPSPHSGGRFQIQSPPRGARASGFIHYCHIRRSEASEKALARNRTVRDLPET